jgi:phage gp16-like protein
MKPKRSTNPDRRRRELAAIHIGIKQLGIDRETYVCMLQRIGKVSSSKDLDERGRGALLEELRRAGFKAVERAKQRTRVDRLLRSAPKEPRDDVKAMVEKVEAMLKDAGREWPYAHGMARRMFGTARVEWLLPTQIHKLIAALEYDRRRRAKRGVK